MRAAVLLDGRITLEDMPEPVPSTGLVIAAPLACGVCGSDLHARDHAPHLCNLLHRAGFRGFMDPARPVVMGHEFCAELLEPAAGLPRGARVVSQPFLMGEQSVVLIGFSNTYNGAFAERMLLQEDALLPVPDHVPTDVAALTEPLAVAVHAVNRADIGAGCVFAVHGCGPVGLFVIARLRALGLGPILAVDPVAARRVMAERMGADAAIAPDGDAVTHWWGRQGLHAGLSDSMVSGDPAKRAVIFECVGRPGMLTALAEGGPVGATVVVIGVCMEVDAIEPALLIQKSIQLRFVFAYDAAEFRTAFDMIVAAPDTLTPMVTGAVTIANLDAAFTSLTAGGEQIKMMVRPA